MKFSSCFICCICIIAAASSCVKNEIDEEFPDEIEQGPVTVIAAPIFEAVVEGDADDADKPERKTTIDSDGKVSFCDNDSIMVNGVQYVYNSNTGYFTTTASSMEVQDNKIKAFYPANISNLRLPKEYTFKDGFNMPMYASMPYSESFVSTLYFIILLVLLLFESLQKLLTQ